MAHSVIAKRFQELERDLTQSEAGFLI